MKGVSSHHLETKEYEIKKQRHSTLVLQYAKESGLESRLMSQPGIIAGGYRLPHSLQTCSRSFLDLEEPSRGGSTSDDGPEIGPERGRLGSSGLSCSPALQSTGLGLRSASDRGRPGKRCVSGCRSALDSSLGGFRRIPRTRRGSWYGRDLAASLVGAEFPVCSRTVRMRPEQFSSIFSRLESGSSIQLWGAGAGAPLKRNPRKPPEGAAGAVYVERSDLTSVL